MVDETQNVLGTVLQSLPGEPEGMYVYCDSHRVV